MGKTRVCGGTCHKAKGAKCRCWCGGVFHGAGGQLTREVFTRELGLERVPNTEREFQIATGQRDLFSDANIGDRWRAAIAAAVSAREGATRGPRV
jgi:hypothetical protein